MDRPSPERLRRLRRTGCEQPAGGCAPGRRLGEVLARVLEEGVVLADADGDLLALSDSAVALMGGPERCDAAWNWLEGRLREAGAGAVAGGRPAGGRFVRDVEFPGESGGARVRATVLALEEDADGARTLVVLLKDRRSIERMQADLQLASKARRRARVLETTAHDLKAPLNALALNLDLLQRELRGAGVLAEVGERVDTLAREVSRLHRMAETALSQFRAPDDAVRRFELGALVRDVASLIAAQAEAAAVDVALQLPPEGLAVRGSRDSVEQALVNLLVNGVEAMPDGGRLEISLRSEGRTARLAVRDDGEGMSTDVARDAFDLHYTRKPGGSGLGLFISRAIVEELGGLLELESVEGAGTTATIELPIVAAGLPDAVPGTPRAADAGRSGADGRGHAGAGSA